MKLTTTIKEILCSVCNVIVEQLDDRHFQITHDPSEATRVMLQLKMNGFTRIDTEGNTTLIRKNF